MTEAIIETNRIEIIIPKEMTMGISKWKKDTSILKPTKESTIANPTFRNLNNPIIPETAK
jgi:dTDP-4-dehydrorhamnose 3,5-epimerase-like enzyme